MIYWLLIIVVIAGAALWLMNLALSRKHALSAADIEEIRRHWAEVERLANDNHEAAWSQSIMQADKLLDLVLTKKRVQGQNLGEKLKNSTHLFHNVQAVWEAHKYRNQLAHEMGVHLSA